MESVRIRLLRVLAAVEPGDEKEVRDLLKMKELAKSLRNPLSRLQPAAHFTGSAVVIDPPGHRVCLVHHTRLGRWLQPGGHAEEGDGGSLTTTALREAREETGCDVHLHPTAPRPFDIDVHRIPDRPGSPAHLHLDLRFLAVARNPEELQHDPNETIGAQWLSWEQTLELADEPALRRMLQKAYRLCSFQGTGAAQPGPR